MRSTLLWLLILISVGLGHEININILNESQICVYRLSGKGKKDEIVINFRGDANYGCDPKTKSTFVTQMGYYVTIRSHKGVFSTQIVGTLDALVKLNTLGVDKSIPLSHLVKILKEKKDGQSELPEDKSKEEKQ